MSGSNTIASTIEDWALNLLDYFGIRKIEPEQGEVATGAAKEQIDKLTIKVGVTQSNKLDELEYADLTKSLPKKLAKIQEAEKKKGTDTPLYDDFKKKFDNAEAEAKKPADPPNPLKPRPSTEGAAEPNLKLRNAVGMLTDLEAEVDETLRRLRVASVDDLPTRSEREQNERLAALNMTPKKGPKEGQVEFVRRLDAFNRKIAEENGTATPADRLARLDEADKLLTHKDKEVQDHTAKLLYRAVSIGMGDCEPLLIQYATELAKKQPDGKTPAGDLPKLRAMAEILCERMVAKDLFGRYVGEMLTGGGAVEKLQNGDADDFYFWSQTSYMVDQTIDTAKLDPKKLLVRLEKSAAAAMFDDLNFGNPWSSDHFRAVFEAISGAYAEKAVERAKAAAKGGSTEPAIILTAYRGVNLGSVLGKTEWPRLKKAIEDNALKFRFDVYCWDGKPVSSGFSAAKWGFADPTFTSVKFSGMAVDRSLTDVAAVEQTTWTFEDYDDLTKRGGLYKGGKGAGSSFAVMPVAFFKGSTLVGKNSSNHICLLNDDGTLQSDSGQDEKAFVQSH